MLKIIEMYTWNVWIIWYLSYISIKLLKNEMTFTILEAVYMGKGPTPIPTVSSRLHDLLTAWPFLGSSAASLTIHPRTWDPFTLCGGIVLSLTVDLFLKTSLVSLGSKHCAFQENIQLVDLNWSKQTQKDEQSLWFAWPPNECILNIDFRDCKT